MDPSKNLLSTDSYFQEKVSVFEDLVKTSAASLRI